MEFISMKKATDKKFESMKGLTLYVVDIDGDTMYDHYLGSFPEGTNLIVKERTQHDCNCCKGWIRAMGNVVAIKDGVLDSIWDIDVGGSYQVVADSMSALIKSKLIRNLFLRDEPVAGVDTKHVQTENGIKTYNHFFTKLPSKFVVKTDDIGKTLSDARSSVELFKRGLTSLTVDAFETVLEMIAQNSLHRGTENQYVLTEFLKLKREFDELTTDQDLFCWSHVNTSDAILRLRNTSIGTLLIALSNGEDLENSVNAYEHKVSGGNYKRSTGVVTKQMRDNANAKLTELGYKSALERRPATINDITINNVLFANRNAKTAMSTDAFDILESKSADNVKSYDKVEEITIENFIKNVLPKAISLEIMVENRHVGNFVSLIAPVHEDSKNLFKWDNKISWSFINDVADAVKERVKNAGGVVDAFWCNRLAWDYTDDLDLFMIEPDGHRIYFSNRRQRSDCGGMLDLDANGADGVRSDPAENIYYADERKLKDGIYTLGLNNFARRSDGRGFKIQIEYPNTVINISSDMVLKNKETIEIAQIHYTKRDGFKILKSLPSSETTATVWNISTQKFHNVSVAMLSPNYWDEKGIGHKHYFFMLENCVNDKPSRPFYNEFLNQELNDIRKVMEMVGAVMKTDVRRIVCYVESKEVLIVLFVLHFNF